MDIPKQARKKIALRKRVRQFRKKPRFLREPKAKPLAKELAQSDLSPAEISKLIGRPYGYFHEALRQHGIKKPRHSPRHITWADEALCVIVDAFQASQEFFRYKVEDRGNIRDLKNTLLEKISVIQQKAGERGKITWDAVRLAAGRLGADDLKRIGREKAPLPLVWTNLKKSEKEKAPSPPLPPVRAWPEPPELIMDAEQFAKPGFPVGFMSRIDWRSDGFREAEVFRGAEIFCAKGCRFFVINAGLVHKQWVKGFVGEYTAGIPKAKRAGAFNAALEEIARGLAFAIPRVRHPTEKGKFIRWYITPSFTHDGPYGDIIAEKLKALRTDDIDIHYPKKGPLIVKEINKNIGIVNSRRSRMPTEYHSNAAERDIKDFETLNANYIYDIYSVGGHASFVHNPRGGERRVPYFTIPAAHRLQGDRVAENQEGVVVLRWSADGSTYSVCGFPLRDRSRDERMYIAGIKEGAKKIHQKIVDVVKQKGAVTAGVLEDALGVPREAIEREIQFLVEPKRSTRKTWPGLYYDPSSRTYDFHSDWIQETLRYPKLSKDWKENRMLVFGCLHAGYCTSDYEYFVRRYPEIILARDVDTLVGVGDFIAGLHHDFLCTGEVFGGLNNDKQETFAAELTATVMMTVFRERFKAAVEAVKPQNSAGVSACIERSLLNFVYTIGNHDEWQKRDGSTPLETFRGKLIGILAGNIQKILVDMHLPAAEGADIVRSRVTLVPQHRPHFELSSGLTMGLHHPFMARAKTSSLRAQEMLKFLYECQVVCVANFHTSIMTEGWERVLGQRAVVQVGTMAIGTSFEMSKMKRVDFGPLFLRVRAQNKRIIMTETEAFPDPILCDPIAEGTDPEQLKTRLGLLRAR
ncbi:MAG: hypothetical protein HYS44_00245 [Candidatus Niyogibacteria bacterium]|nr:hypothetical protein [Candidatus Niyogibacteria bacterium]